jgi:DNA-binding CsgD family transcriptional regulator/tetratricopeptide (TPR) repeat protein
VLPDAAPIVVRAKPRAPALVVYASAGMAARRPPVLLGRGSERQLLDRLLENVRGGQSAVLVIRGDEGVGKTALLRYCARQASGFRVARIAGVESEMELPFAGLHQLCAPLLGRLGAVPAPQQDALRVALGLSSGSAPDRFLVALAALSLLAEVAAERPLLCFVDDSQWLDGASGQVLGFVARRLLAESVAIVFAVREPSDEPDLVGLPELALGGLPDEDARALLATVIPGRLDERVRDRLVAEARGNPLAIVELPRELAATQMPGVVGAEGAHALSGRIQESYLRRLEALPEDARLLLLVAAAEPVDDPLLVWRAAERLGLSVAAADETEGLLEIGTRVAFLHPLVRSAVYRSASTQERRAVHRALADVTDADADADRRAWHLAAAAPGPDAEVASELERSAGRAQARGGLGAAAAFLERAATLSPDRSRRSRGLLAAAGAKRDAGAPDVALTLLAAVDSEALDELGRARVEVLRGEIAFDQLRVGEAARRLAGAARLLEPVDISLARRTHLEALGAAMWLGDRDGPAGVQTIAEAALHAPPAPAAPAASDALLDGVALLWTKGHQAAAPSLRRALELVLAPQPAADDHGHWLRFAVAGNAITIAQELWDADAWHALATRHEQSARDTGALVQLQFAVIMVAWVHLLAGEITKSSLLIEEDRMIAEATGNPSLPYGEMLVAAWRGQERRAAELIEATLQEAPARGRVACYAAYASAVLHNGLGRHAEAREAARSAFEPDHLGYGPFVVPELAEAAARTGDAALLCSVREWLTERTLVTRSPWSLATEARVRALMSEGEAAESAYREAIGRLRRTWLRPERARAHLLFGEWLRREGRRTDAREQLRTAHEMLAAIGMEAFAERAGRELAATGEKVRKRTVATRDELTPQERQIARLARDGLSNPEIGARLFLSPRTVEWHLKKVFTKLGISSRMGLHDALPSRGPRATPA